MQPIKFYRKQDIQAEYLFRDKIQQEFNLPATIVMDVVEKLWPTCPEKQMFIDAAEEKKALVISQGWAYRGTPWLALTNETESMILELDPRLNSEGGAACSSI